jgi:hypothetical protein
MTPIIVPASKVDENEGVIHLLESPESAQVASSRATQRIGFWEGDLGYLHAAVAANTALVTGLFLHLFVGYGTTVQQLFAALAALLLATATVAGRVGRMNRVVHWLTGIPFAVASTAAVGVLALIGGIVPQSVFQGRFGVPSIWASWPFLMAVFLMMVNLLGSVGKRSWPLNYTNIVYLSSHAGLAIALLGGAYGAMTMERSLLVLFEGRETSMAETREGRQVALPFAVTLRKFEMETFAPTLVLLEMDSSKPNGFRQTPGAAFCATGSTEKIGSFSVRVAEFKSKAAQTGEIWRDVPFVSAAPAALVEVTAPNGAVRKGWVSCGSADTPQAMLKLADGTAIAMAEPRPKRFASQVEIAGTPATVEVNRPVRHAGYELYQVSYDEKMGALSEYSVIEAVRDPGLPIVYFGFGLLLVGAFLHLWNGIGGKR